VGFRSVFTANKSFARSLLPREPLFTQAYAERESDERNGEKPGRVEILGRTYSLPAQYEFCIFHTMNFSFARIEGRSARYLGFHGIASSNPTC
jgi:hypothetical protein